MLLRALRMFGGVKHGSQANSNVFLENIGTALKGSSNVNYIEEFESLS
jgi:hypothetical protein